MTDSVPGASLRLSNAERDRAVAALQSHAGDGRLTDSELQTRVQSARVAVTRGDLAPLFADLPGFVDFDGVAGGETERARSPALPHPDLPRRGTTTSRAVR
ncbi:DUF1707 SHOCT-like domain-containing protein [Leifsonia poae]|uniref:DUF1707 SHOCT-like domain-containing protein n=1 Tax=Leifsonia poae TaxID=110933 RepID=UPI003D67D871